MEVSNFIFVLGMHRSGTSALAGLLHNLGFYAGSQLLPPRPDNLKGFFENEKVIALNDRILWYLNSNWDTPNLSPNILIDSLNQPSIESEIQLCLEEYLSSGNASLMIKDPRISLLFPIWNKVLLDQNIRPKIIICVRHPLDVAKSLHKRNAFSEAKSLLLWEYYNFLCEYHTRNHLRYFFGL